MVSGIQLSFNKEGYASKTTKTISQCDINFNAGKEFANSTQVYAKRFLFIRRLVMIRSKKQIRGMVVVMMAAILFVLIAAYHSATETDDTFFEGETVNQTTKFKTDSDEVAFVSDMIVSYDILELAERSSAVVYGTVTEISDPFYVKGVNILGSMIDVTIKPKAIFRGKERESYTLRIEGGPLYGVETEYLDIPEFILGSEYLLFLTAPNCGGALNTKGDYFYLAGYYQGVFVPVQQEKIQKYIADSNTTNDTFFVNSKNVSNGNIKNDVSYDVLTDIEGCISPIHAIFSLQQLTQNMPSVNKAYPIDLDRSRNESLDAYATNLKNGFISQEEYDRLVQELEVYAEILTAEEYEEYAKEYEAELSAQKELLRKSIEDASGQSE